MLKYTQAVFNVIARLVRYDADICNEKQNEIRKKIFTNEICGIRLARSVALDQLAETAAAPTSKC